VELDNAGSSVGGDPVKPRNRLSDAVWTAFTEGLRFVVVPIVLIDLITKNYPLLTTPFMSQIREYILVFGGMVVAASSLEAMNKPGSFKRLLFGMSSLGFVCMWIFVMFGGGLAEFTYGPYHFKFDLTKVVYIMLVGIGLKGLLVMTTYSDNRQSLIDEIHEKRLEKAAATREIKRSRPSTRTRSTSPEFATYSRLAFEVTHDDSVGYEPPPPPPHTVPSAPQRTIRTVRFKTCPICGEKALTTETVCRNCGAWFSRDSFRFEKSS
jgi:hypothetical protein